MIDKVDLDYADAEFAGYFCGRPMADSVEVENLRVLRLYALANPGDRRSVRAAYRTSFCRSSSQVATGMTPSRVFVSGRLEKFPKSLRRVVDRER